MRMLYVSEKPSCGPPSSGGVLSIARMRNVTCRASFVDKSSAVLPAHYFMQILAEAGLPPGVINLVPGPGPVVPDAAGLATAKGLCL